MKAIDRLTADIAAPLLKGLGFKRQGRKFRNDLGDGLLAYVGVDPYPFGKADCEFHCNIAIIVDTYSDFIHRYGPRRSAPTDSEAMWGERVHVPWDTSDGLFDPALWLIDLDDAERIAGFRDALLGSVRSMLDVATVPRLLDLAAREQRAVARLRPNPIAAEALLRLKIPDFHRVRELLPEVAQRDPSGDLETWIRDRLPA